MKIKTIYGQIIKPRQKLIAAFGQARLVRCRDGKYELIGGLPEDLAQAREWISLFLHEAVPLRRIESNAPVKPAVSRRCGASAAERARACRGGAPSEGGLGHSNGRYPTACG